jgi:histidyl-tRNA synthetase
MKPTLPQGTRDFGAEVLRKRQYIINTIKQVFETYAFEALETPAMENLETLVGKYGEEGDKLMFKILNNGLERPEKHDKARADFEKILAGKSNSQLTERALRYDLTIPFARYVAMNIGQLTLPFRRYQIQPVWRADRPQRGRYREFYQCDADVVGSQNGRNEIELVQIYATVFSKLGLAADIKINNRKILAALAERCGGSEKLTDITIAIDKLDKIGLEKVKAELLERGLSPTQLVFIEQYLSITGPASQQLAELDQLIGQTQLGKNGIEELTYVLKNSNLSGTNCSLVPDFTLARGLNYYTGSIFEVKAVGAQMGSIGGGGRYDDLTGLFGVPNVPGVGISFGLDRIYDVLEELALFPESLNTSGHVLFFNLGIAEGSAAFGLMQQARHQGIACELYDEPAKFDKQFKYAERKRIGLAVIVGTKEMQEQTCIVKQLHNGMQHSMPQTRLIEHLHGLLAEQQ